MRSKSKSRADELADKILYHKRCYYQGQAEVSDEAYDCFEDELRRIDPDHYALKVVGFIYREEEKQGKVPHKKKMLSLGKTTEWPVLQKWIGGNEVVSTFKFDGVSCSLVYEKGMLVLAKTRGDGSLGEDITSKVYWMKSVPKELMGDGNSVEVRGEVFCREEQFLLLSQEMERIGLGRPTSQRNIVSGLIGRKDHLELCRYLDFVAFDLMGEERYTREMEKYTKLDVLGFEIPEVHLHKSWESVEAILKKAQHFLSEGDFQIDGMVFTYDDLELHEKLGTTAGHPRYKMAFKFKGEEKVTTIVDIEWSVSRNGTVTPVAIVEATSLAGAQITRVTLHNYGMVKQYSLKRGDKIRIVRSGEVIPKFLEVVEANVVEKFTVPSQCPSCNSKLREFEIRLVCENEQCPAKNLEAILHFVKNIGVDDLSFKRLEEMVKKGLVKDIPDLYRIEKKDLLILDKVKDKLANKLWSSIQKSKQSSLLTFLTALGLSGGAYNKCEKIVKAGFDTLPKILAMTEVELQGIEGFAEKSSQEFYSSLHSKRELINQLYEVGVEILADKSNRTEVQSTQVTGKKFCITGALSLPRNEMEQMIRDRGGEIASSVSKNTDFLVSNEEVPSSSKFKKAMELEVPIINEDQLMKLLSEGQ
ncbi:MAG: NAD-dependent DNA ligase LigA [Oligoflexia bacterium]|nr:NAD-dependent DNA ligase LigA [Oligoflexia bacterium]